MAFGPHFSPSPRLEGHWGQRWARDAAAQGRESRDSRAIKGFPESMGFSWAVSAWLDLDGRGAPDGAAEVRMAPSRWGPERGWPGWNEDVKGQEEEQGWHPVMEAT